MNIALEQTEEHVNGVVTNRYGDAFIRGNNGQYCLRYEKNSLLSFLVQYCTYQLQSQFNLSKRHRYATCPSRVAASLTLFQKRGAPVF